MQSWKTKRAKSKRKNLLVLDVACASPKGVRHEILAERDYLIAPVVAIVECVMECSTCDGPTYVPAEAIVDSADAWEGVVVTFGHPAIADQRVPLHSHPRHDDLAIGVFRNVEATDDGDLNGELWIDTERLRAHEGGVDVIEAIERGQVVEVSIGAMTSESEREGIFGGKRFVAEVLAIVPDHLALLPLDQRGACSPDTGCGVNLAAMAKQNQVRPLTSMISDQVRAEIRAELRGVFDRMRGRKEDDEMKKKFAATCSCASTFGKLAATGAMAFQAAEVSDMDLRTSIESALAGQLGPESYFWVAAVFSDRFVYALGSELFEQSYSSTSNGAVTLKGEPSRVRPVTSFVKLVQASDGMATAEPVAEVVESVVMHESPPVASAAPESSATGEETAQASPAVTEPVAEAPPSAPTDEESAAPTNPARTVEDLVSGVDGRLAAEIREAIEMRNVRRASLIEQLGLEADEAAALSTPTLEKLAAKAGSASTVQAAATPAATMPLPKPMRFDGRGEPEKTAVVASAAERGLPPTRSLRDAFKQRNKGTAAA